MQIDGQTYKKAGKVRFTLGTGEGASSLTYFIFQGPDQRLVYLHKDDKVHRLYTLAEPTNLKLHSVCEHENASQFKGGGEMRGKKPEARWGSLKDGCPLEGPFRGSKDAFQWAEGGQQQTFYATNLVEDRPGKWASPNWGASQLTQPELPLRRGAPLDWLSVLFLSLAGLLLWRAGHQDAGSMSWLWWYCGLLGIARSGREPGRFAADLLGATIGIHFMTYGVDVLFFKLQLQFEVAKFVSIFAGLLVLRWQDRRLYSQLYRSGMDGAGASWLFMVLGLILWCSIDEYNYFTWFAEYAGSLPWCLLWPIVWGYFFHKLSKDFSKAPLHYRGFCQLLHRLTEGLKQTPKQVKELESDLVAWCDDLEDSLRLSGDPKLRLVSAYADEMLRLQTMLRQLSRLKQAYRIEADLQTLVDDLQALRQVVDQGQGPLKGLRLSPYLRCLEG